MPPEAISDVATIAIQGMTRFCGSPPCTAPLPSHSGRHRREFQTPPSLAEPPSIYESKTQPPLTRIRFIQRVLLHAAAALALLVLSLLAGLAGYAHFERLSWLDAFLNSAMLMDGMGPVDAPKTDGGKLFAGLYALYASLIFLFAAGVIFTPVSHRMLHKFYWDEDG